MVSSMTAFGQSSIECGSLTLTWEIKSVNHRFLDMHLRLPEGWAAMETAVRDALGQRLHRGKIDGVLQLDSDATPMSQFKLDHHVLQQLLGQLSRLTGQLNDNGVEIAAIDTVALLQWPGLLYRRAATVDETVHVAAMQALEAAIVDLCQARQREGEQISRMLTSRCESILSLLSRLADHRPAVVARQRENLVRKLAQLNIEHDESRLEQELVYLVQRLDIDEEIDRLRVHLEALAGVLAMPGPIGRRLDFLMQEFNREINTIGSKAADSVSTASVVDMKVLVEQMREQVQNVE